MSDRTSKKTFAKGLFIHRRDLRVQDNTALNQAVAECESVLSCFILDPVQIGSSNDYRSEKQLYFMRQSLEDLEAQYKKVDGKLYIFSGNPEEVIKTLITDEAIQAIFFNADYTPYAKDRDTRIAKMAETHLVPLFVSHDLLLAGDPDATLTNVGKPYTVFTQYWKKAATVLVHKPVALRSATFVTKGVATLKVEKLSEKLPKFPDAEMAEQGGRTRAREILSEARDYKKYATTHNDLPEHTTRLSAHNKFGTVSVREVYHSFGRALTYTHPLIRQLYWRDFYTMLVYFFPHVIGSSFDPKHEILYWSYDDTAFDAWKEGKTGIPIVDAGMRELLATGYLHNRARLIVGSFLTKDLHQPWWRGEKHFAQHLIDYDISVNNGNWQWVGGTGADPVPYFRIFNPWLQGKKFDPQALYIRHWVPELAALTPEQIHALPKKPLPESVDYPKPMVDHYEEMQKVRALYKKRDETT